MAALNTIARTYADEIRDGIAWVIVWKTGRSWNAESVWLECNSDTFEPEDVETVKKILEEDPNAVMLNGYYCGHFGEDMNAAEIADGIRWHYENSYNLLADSTAFPEETTAAEPVELTVKIEPETADAILSILQPAIDAIVQSFQEFARWAAETFRKAAASMREAAQKFVDSLLRSANDNPKWWHLYKHAKKARTRKKYRRRLMQQLTAKLTAT